MRKSLFYIVVGIIAVGIIVLNTNSTVKYLTCEDPDNYGYTINEVTEDEVEIYVTTFSSADTYSDFKYHIEDGTLYLGVKFVLNPLNSSPEGSYTITIELDEEITSIVLKGSNNEKVIYPE